MFSDDLHTEDRLLVLLALDNLNMPITGLYLSDLLLGPGLMNYFNIQSALSDLVAAGCVLKVPDEDGIPMYSISEKGRATYLEFAHLLPEGLANKYDEYITAHKADIKRQVEVNGTVYSSAGGKYFVRCYIRDGSEYLIDMKLPAADKDDAEAICRRWKEDPSEIYSDIVKILHKQ